MENLMMTKERWAEYQRAGIIRRDKTFEDFIRELLDIEPRCATCEYFMVKKTLFNREKARCGRKIAYWHRACAEYKMSADHAEFRKMLERLIAE